MLGFHMHFIWNTSCILFGFEKKQFIHIFLDNGINSFWLLFKKLQPIIIEVIGRMIENYINHNSIKNKKTI